MNDSNKKHLTTTAITFTAFCLLSACSNTGINKMTYNPSYLLEEKQKTQVKDEISQLSDKKSNVQKAKEIKPFVFNQKIIKKEKNNVEDNVDDLLNELLDEEPVSKNEIEDESFNISSVKSEEVSQDKLILKETSNIDDTLPSSKKIDGFSENRILSLSSDNHIINLATVSANTDVNVFISEYELDDDLITVFVYGQNSQYKKILYGNYVTFDEVTEVLTGLNKKVLKNKPYISRISKNKDLYHKFH